MRQPRAQRPLRRRWKLSRRVFAEVRAHRAAMAGIFALDLLGTPLALLTPVPLKIAVDSIIGDQPLPGLLRTALGPFAGSTFAQLLAVSGLLLLFVLLTQLQQLAAYFLRVRAGEGLTLDFQVRLFEHAERLSLAYHDVRGTSDSLYRIQYDSYALWHLAIDKALSLVASAVMLVAMLVVTAQISWQLALVAVTVAPLLLAISSAYVTRAHKWYHGAKERESAALHVIQEVLSGLRAVKAFGREEQERGRFEHRAREGVRARVHLAVAESTHDGLVNLTLALGSAAVLFIGVSNVQSGVLSLGELLLVMAYLAQLYTPLEEMSRQMGDVESSLVSAERAFELFDEEPDVPEWPSPRPLGRARGRLEFRKVSFSYDRRTKVLDDVSFVVEPGTKLGIAGRTGAGKTTLASLAIRFYDPTSGSILLDGVDLRYYRLADLRRQFSVVLQEPVLFSTSIEDNIRYARPEASFEEIVAAAKAANAHEFIGLLPDGYDTEVGERGMRLSGGERQRIALARAFLKDAPILILDEPTSAVDVGTEALIMEAMERLLVGRAALVIAHRLSTLEDCDARLVVEGGRIVSVSQPDRRVASLAVPQLPQAPAPT